MIAVIAGTATVCVLCWRERPTARRVIVSLLASLVVCQFAPFFFAHLCWTGYPFMQIILWMGCVIALLSCVPPWRVATVLAGVVSILMACLCNQYVSMVHRHDLTGSPFSIENVQLHSYPGEAVEQFRLWAVNDTTEYAAGWLSDAPILPPEHFLSQELKHESFVRVEISRFWHTWFTRLWARKVHPVALWYSGGPLSEARLEWRDRPSK